MRDGEKPCSIQLSYSDNLLEILGLVHFEEVNGEKQQKEPWGESRKLILQTLQM